MVGERGAALSKTNLSLVLCLAIREGAIEVRVIVLARKAKEALCAQAAPTRRSSAAVPARTQQSARRARTARTGEAEAEAPSK